MLTNLPFDLILTRNVAGYDNTQEEQEKRLDTMFEEGLENDPQDASEVPEAGGAVRSPWGRWYIYVLCLPVNTYI